jgi:hypothetical protein
LLDESYPQKLRLKANDFLVWLFKGLQINALKIMTDASKKVAAYFIKSPFVDFVINLGKECAIQLRYSTV